jgi:hypothetical protein
MVVATATANFIDIDLPSPQTDRPMTQNRPPPARQSLSGTFLTAPANRLVSTRGGRWPASRGNKENVRNKVNDLKTTLGGKDAGALLRVLTRA